MAIEDEGASLQDGGGCNSITSVLQARLTYRVTGQQR